MVGGESIHGFPHPCLRISFQRLVEDVFGTSQGHRYNAACVPVGVGLRDVLVAGGLSGNDMALFSLSSSQLMGRSDALEEESFLASTATDNSNSSSHLYLLPLYSDYFDSSSIPLLPFYVYDD